MILQNEMRNKRSVRHEILIMLSIIFEGKAICSLPRSRQWTVVFLLSLVENGCSLDINFQTLINFAGSSEKCLFFHVAWNVYL